VIICLERGANDLYMVQLMPLPPHHLLKSKSVKPRPRYGDFFIFEVGGRRHLGFLKFEVFNGRAAQED